MKKTVLLLLFTYISILSISQVKADDILGDWVSEKQDSRILIFKQNNQYFGKIVWGKGDQIKDYKNPVPELRNKELINLIILKEFKFNGIDAWSNGTIYDPREGKTYSCKITLKDKGLLNIRGYVGISLFGRTEIWQKYIVH
jgi:uncharacterized protein (DUF2147 family)